jgi:iron complex transport system substrate-binding protein
MQQADGSIGNKYIPTSWAVLAIAAAGEDPHNWPQNGHDLIDYLSANASANLNPNTATDWERMVLSIVSAGDNPRSFGGINYTDKLLAFYNNNQMEILPS